MKNYRDSDYAVNKFSEGIVYRFDGETVEVTLADYLRENTDKTEEDFKALKELSDQMYREQDRADNAQTKKNVSIHKLEETSSCATEALDDEYVISEDKRRAMEAAVKLFHEGKMTEKQKRRFILHFMNGMPLRKIADIEGVHFTSVAECISCATDKLRQYFKNTR